MTLILSSNSSTDKWVSLADREPPPGRYLARFHNGKESVIVWPGKWKDRSRVNAMIRCEITHWAELEKS